MENNSEWLVGSIVLLNKLSKTSSVPGSLSHDAAVAMETNNGIILAGNKSSFHFFTKNKQFIRAGQLLFTYIITPNWH